MVALTAERKAGAAPRPAAAAAPGAPRPAHGPAWRRRGAQTGVPGVESDHRGRLRQGRRRQIHHRGQSRARPGVLGLKVGILDADIYGPSLPKLLAIKEQPQTLGGTRLKPISRYGLTVMSIGFLIDEETPMIWRGPMVISALTQMLREVEWGELDVMVVDMPPGTGDAQLTMAQQVPLKGAVIVSTPQDLALIDARRGIAMFSRVNVPVLGIVENMSYFPLPEMRRALRHFRPRRRARGGRAARRAVPRRGAAACDHPREIGCRPAGGGDRARRPACRRSIATSRRACATSSRDRPGAGGAEDRDRRVAVSFVAAVLAKGLKSQHC